MNYREAFEQSLLKYNTEEAYLLKNKSEYNAGEDAYCNKKHPDLIDEVLTGHYHSFKKGWKAAKEHASSAVINHPDICPICKKREVIQDEDWCGLCREDFYYSEMESQDR